MTDHTLYRRYERAFGRHRAAVRLRRPRRARGQRRATCSAGRRQADPGGVEVGALGAVIERVLELGDGFHGLLTFTAAEALWLAAQGFEDLVFAYPTADRRARSARSRDLTEAEPDDGAGADGRLPRAPRPDRGRGREALGADPGRDRRRRRLVAARRAGQGRAEALADPDRRGREGRSRWRSTAARACGWSG